MEGQTIKEDCTIDIVRIVRSRKGGEKVPGFLLRIIKRMIHQDFLNEFLSKGYTGAEFCREAIRRLDIKEEIEGLENLKDIPEGAHCTFACNHPLGGVDGVIMLDILLPFFDGKVRLLVNDFLMSLKGLSPLCIPVNKTGGQSKGLASAVHGAFDSDNEMLIFPAGQCSRKYDGIIQDREWSKTFVTESIRTGRYIVPVHFKAENSKRFYRVDRICRMLGIKFNLPMLLLPDELYRSQHKTIKVSIGKPVDSATLDPTKGARALAQDLRTLAYTL